MSISLPNGTLLAAGPSTSTAQYTAAVTRILHLSNFSAELKTRDLQAMFREYENDKGGFRIKWVDDVNALVVFADAATTKKAYLSFLLAPPSNFLGQIKPYDKPDAGQIIQTLQARAMGHRGSMSNAHSSISPPSVLSNPFEHTRTLSTSTNAAGGYAKRASFSTPVTAPAGTRHSRTGSSGASASFSRGSMGGIGAGALNFGNGLNGVSGGARRLPTHAEGSAIQEPRSGSSSDTEPIISMDPPGMGSLGNSYNERNEKDRRGSFGGWKMGSASSKARRDSLSAEKAMKEVEKALAAVPIST